MNPEKKSQPNRLLQILLQTGVFVVTIVLLAGANLPSYQASPRNGFTAVDSPEVASNFNGFFSLEDMFVEAERSQYAGSADPKSGMVCLGEMPPVMRMDTLLTPAQWAEQDANGPKFLNLEKITRAIGYPEAAKSKKVEGSVIVKLLVDEQGLVLRYKFINEVDPILRDAVAANIEDLRLKPGTQNGKVSKWWVVMPFHFGKGGC